MRIIILLFLAQLFINTTSAQLMNYDLTGKPKQVELSKKLKEISGLALTDDGRLFAHGDEKGTVYQLDLETGDILKEFELGDKKVEEDFEDITIVNDKFFMVVSNGDIYEFEEGENGKKVEYIVFKTSLKSKYDVEGLCYDPKTESLLLACKEYAGKDFEKSRAVYSYNVASKKTSDTPVFLISLDKIEKKWDIDNFNPSAIERHPLSGNYFILGGKGLAILEVSENGKIVSNMILSKKHHHQPEGLVFLNDGTMLISDEADKDNATLTFYKYSKD